MKQRNELRLHEDQDLFRESVEFTSAETGFPQRLVEKDYYCSVLLNYFANIQKLVFRGGTCLAKVHANFYRLSEDLDFVLPLSVDAKRKVRRNSVKPVKEAFERIEIELAPFKIDEELTGANQSTQYNGTLVYESLFTGKAEPVKIEIGLREPLNENIDTMNVRTLLLNPVNNKPMISDFKFSCISRREAFAEKFRAALTRREVAIRDFFDIDYAVNYLKLDIEDAELVNLARKKLTVPGNYPVDVSNDRFAILQRQLETELKPVLRTKDYNQFDLNRAFKIVQDMSNRII